jgi:hypothetical protein
MGDVLDDQVISASSANARTVNDHGNAPSGQA